MVAACPSTPAILNRCRGSRVLDVRSAFAMWKKRLRFLLWFVPALLVAGTALAVLLRVTQMPVGFSSRDLNANPRTAYALYLKGTESRVSNGEPLFGFGGVVHVREALSELGAELGGCQRVDSAVFGTRSIHVRVAPERDAFVVVGVEQGVSTGIQSELACIRDIVASTELAALARFTRPPHSDYLLNVSVVRTPGARR